MEIRQWNANEWLPILAASNAEAGDFESAVNWQEKVAPKSDEETQALALFQKGKPRRENAV